MQKFPKKDEQSPVNKSSEKTSSTRITDIQKKFEQSSQVSQTTSKPPKLPPRRTNSTVPSMTPIPKDDANTTPLGKNSIKQLTQQLEKKLSTVSPIPHQKANSQPVAPISGVTETRKKVHTLATELQSKLPPLQFPLHPRQQPTASNITEEAIRTSISERAQSIEKKLSMYREKPIFTRHAFDSRLDIEHSYFQLFFESKKKQFLFTLDSTMAAFLKHGPAKTIVEELFKKEVAAIQLSHSTLRELIDGFKKIITTAMQYRKFFLAIEAHDENSEKPLPESIKDINILNGMYNLLITIPYNKLEDETLIKIRNEIKEVYGQNFTDIPEKIPQDPKSLSDAFTIFIRKMADTVKIDVNDRPFYSKLDYNDILVEALTLTPNTGKIFNRKVTDILQALSNILANKNYQPTPAERRNASLNALLLYTQLATNTPLDIPLNGNLALIMVYLLQEHHPREMPKTFNKNNEIYQRLSIVAELSTIIHEQPAPRPYSLREQVIIDLYKELFTNIEPSFLAKQIVAALQNYLDEYDEKSDLLIYLNRIVVNAAKEHNEEKQQSVNKQLNRRSTVIKTTINNSPFYDIDSDLEDEASTLYNPTQMTGENQFTITDENDVVPLLNIRNSKQQIRKRDWAKLIAPPDQIPLEYQFTGILGKRIELAWVFLKELSKLAEQEKVTIKHLTAVVENIEFLEKKLTDFSAQKKAPLSDEKSKELEENIENIRSELMATNKLPYKSSLQLMLNFLKKHGPNYLQNLAKESSASSIASFLTRLLGNTGGEFNCAHISSDILHFIHTTKGGYKTILASTAPDRYWLEKEDTKAVMILINQDKEEKEQYFIGPNRFRKYDEWLRQLYKLFEQQFLTLNHELRPEIVDALGPENIELILKKIDKATFINNVVASYAEFVGGYLNHLLMQLDPNEQPKYVHLNGFATNRIQNHILMQYPAAFELMQFLKMLFFLHDNSASKTLSQQVEKIKELIEKFDSELSSVGYCSANKIANYFLATFDIANKWNFSETSNNEYEAFLAWLKPLLLDWLQTNIEELSIPARNKNFTSIIDKVHKAFFDKFSEDYFFYQKSVNEVKTHHRKTSIIQGRINLFKDTEQDAPQLTFSRLMRGKSDSHEKQTTQPSLGNMYAKK